MRGVPWSSIELEILKREIDIGGTKRQIFARLEGFKHSYDSFNWQYRKLRGYRRFSKKQGSMSTRPEIVSEKANSAQKNTTVDVFSKEIPQNTTYRGSDRAKPTTYGVFSYHEPMERVLCLQDAHFPDNLPILSIKKFIAQYKPTILNLVGDMLDPHGISHWEEPNWLNRGMDNVVYEFNQLCVQFHTFMINLTDGLPSNCKIIYHIGNHEDWIAQFCKKFPQLNKITISDVIGDIGKEIEFIPRYEFHKIGKITFTHGEHFNNQSPSKSYVERCKSSIAFGHHHYYAVHSDHSMVDDTNKYIGISMPCWTPKSASYGHKQPNKWNNGFVLFNIKKNSGNFSHHPILASPNGNFIDPYGQEFEN